MSRSSHPAPKLGSAPTVTELRILLGMAEGKNQHQVAKENYISVTTVKSHLGRLAMRLGSTSTSNSVYIAARRGLLPLGAEDPTP